MPRTGGALPPLADLPLELGFLITAVRAFLGAHLGSEPFPLDAGQHDWGSILRRAQQERLIPLLYFVFRAVPTPIPNLGDLREAWLAAMYQNLVGVGQLVRIVSALEREGLAVIVLKGPALAEAIYPDPALRPFTDLDLLIPRADRSRALELLRSLGYQHVTAGRPLNFELAYEGAASFVKDGGPPAGFPLDLHWELLSPPGRKRVGMMETREVWERAVTLKSWGRSVRILCPEDLLIYLAVHSAIHHAFAGLIWQLDLALLLRRYGSRLDWRAVGERAQRWGVDRALYFALTSIAKPLATDVPASALDALRPCGLRASTTAWLLRRQHPSRGFLEYAMPLFLMGRGTDVLRMLWGSLLPDPAWVSARYGGGSLPRAYLAHCARLGRIVAGFRPDGN